ncbi:cupin domain-containing protein [Tenacibaculum sp. SDUM215027]|uniref:cupin domain-containing protein n=1 Tax=Tenacibaculum sp. SDUM215027 TaxID=3422596 RepID=UPI003D31F038
MSIKNYIAKSEQITWNPLVENDVHYQGVYVKSLHFDKATQRSKAILLKFEKGASYPYHSHPAGEEVFVLNGSCEIFGETLEQGDYLYTPPNGKHSVKTQHGCVLFLSVPEEVVLISEEND